MEEKRSVVPVNVQVARRFRGGVGGGRGGCMVTVALAGGRTGRGGCHAQVPECGRAVNPTTVSRISTKRAIGHERTTAGMIRAIDSVGIRTRGGHSRVLFRAGSGAV